MASTAQNHSDFRLKFERTFDYELVRSIMIEPEIYGYMVSDGAPSAEDFRPGRGSHLWYVLISDGDDLLGLFLAVPFNRATWEIHTMFYPGVGLRRAIAAYREGLKWLAQHSSCRKVMGAISHDNKRALVVALRAGCEKVGVLTKSIQKRGVLLDQTLVACSL